MSFSGDYAGQAYFSVGFPQFKLHDLSQGTATALGQSTDTGDATLTSGSGPCMTVTSDVITLTGADGTIGLKSTSGSACLDLTSSLGEVQIHGTGTYVVTGGTGDFEGATGGGTFNVTAVVNGIHASLNPLLVGPTAHFADLQFRGTLTLPEAMRKPG